MRTAPLGVLAVIFWLLWHLDVVWAYLAGARQPRGVAGWRARRASSRPHGHRSDPLTGGIRPRGIRLERKADPDNPEEAWWDHDLRIAERRRPEVVTDEECWRS